MSDIKKIAERPIVTITDSFTATDFKIYVAPVNAKRISNHLHMKHKKEQDILSHVARKYHSIRSNSKPPFISRKVKQALGPHSILHYLTRIFKTHSHKEPLPLNTERLEKIIHELRRNLEKATKLHVLINESIQKKRENPNQKVSDIELGYLARLVMNKIYRLPLDPESSKSQNRKTIEEIKDIFDIIEDHLLGDVSVYLSIDRGQTLKDKQLLGSVNKQIKKLSHTKQTLIDEIHVLIQ